MMETNDASPSLPPDLNPAPVPAPTLGTCLLGAMEINLFMRQGLTRFPKDLRGMVVSFLVPFALMPLTYWAVFLTQPYRSEISEKSFQYVAFLFFSKDMIVGTLGLIILYIFAKAYNRLDQLCHTITAGNWAGLFPSLIFFPAFLALDFGWYDWAGLYPVCVVFSLYAYVLSAYILTRGLGIPWEMGGFLAIIGLAINENGFHVLYWLAS